MSREKRHLKWTKELIAEEALYYEYKSDFKKKEPNLYKKVIKNGWDKDVFSHMKHKPKKWIKEKCFEVAKNCTSRCEFMRKYNGAYTSALKRGWLDEISKKYFSPIGNKRLRCIYVCEFDDKKVYVGLTCNLKKRIQQHNTNSDSAVYRYQQATGKIGFFKQITEYIPYYEASEEETRVLNEYIDNGWEKLNIAKTGGLGSIFEKSDQSSQKSERVIYDKDKSLECASKCETKTELMEKYSGAYRYLKNNNLLDIACKHMRVPFIWTKDSALKEALKYKTKKEFAENANGCYQVVLKNKWMEDIGKHFIDVTKERIIYTEKNVIETVKLYVKMEQLKKSPEKFVRGCYWWMKKHKKLNDFKIYLKNE